MAAIRSSACRPKLPPASGLYRHADRATKPPYLPFMLATHGKHPTSQLPWPLPSGFAPRPPHLSANHGLDNAVHIRDQVTQVKG